MQTSPSTGYRAYVLFILVVVYTFNFIDRQIVGILAIPIKEELGLSDIPLSLMGGLPSRCSCISPQGVSARAGGRCGQSAPTPSLSKRKE